MRFRTFARCLVAAGALQAIGCSDDPVVGGRDTGVDTSVDVVTTDGPAPDMAQPDAAPDVAQPDVAQPDVTQPDAAPDALPDAVEDVAPDTIVEDVPGDVAPDTIVEDVPGDVAPDTVVEDVPGDVTPDVAPDVMMGECATSADCASSMGGPVCDTAARRCVPCTATEDVCAVGNYCASNRCVPGCRNEMDCTGSMRCDTASHMCVGCVADTDCAIGTVCRMNACVPGCGPGRACGAGSTCCGTSCVNTQTDTMNCGACGTAVPTGSTCCNGAVVNLQTSATNCGACGTGCTVANATAACVAGRCAVGSCSAGFADCDMDATNGCEVNTATTAANCGACGNVCAAAEHATPTCAMGACGVTCATGFANCDGMAANGCEVATATSATNCGRCGNACAAAANAAPACVAGACGFTCNMGFGNCDGMAANGCEANLATSASHCGACGRACAPPNALGACTAGACGVGTCNAGFANCDGMVANGCEVNTRNDRNNCGACGTRCAASAVCFDGTCRDLCTPPLAICGTVCVDTRSDNNNCGACGTRCVAGANSTSSCSSSACALTCARGFGNCDGMAANGCEVNLTNTATNCGACGVACSFPNAAAACANGACVRGACNAGFADCDGNPANGCEVDVRAMAGNCGACGRVCSFPNAAATCAASACALGTCNAGWANCDGSATNGCETNTNTSTLNCGACRRACASGQACSAGTCVSACPTGTTFCAGGCINLQSNATNCGACGRVCATGQACVMGACSSVAPSNDTRAGAIPINLSTASTDIPANTAAATHDLDTPCLGSAVNGGRDVYYRFTLTRREFVFADTVGSTFDTVLFFADSSGVRITSTVSGDQVCNDDISGDCMGGGLNSRVFTLLAPGDYYLVLSGYGTAAGAATIHFEHVPAGGGAVATLAQGTSTLTGVTSSTAASALNSATCGGAASENAYWWVTCPATGTSAALTADTCGTATFDSVLYLNTGSGFTACNDNGATTCAPQSQLSASYSLATRLHALYIDGFTASSAGSYTLRVNRP